MKTTQYTHKYCCKILVASKFLVVMETMAKQRWGRFLSGHRVRDVQRRFYKCGLTGRQKQRPSEQATPTRWRPFIIIRTHRAIAHHQATPSLVTVSRSLLSLSSSSAPPPQQKRQRRCGDDRVRDHTHRVRDNFIIRATLTASTRCWPG